MFFFLKKKIKNNFFLSLIIFIFLLSPQIKLFNSNATYFDLKIYLNNIDKADLFNLETFRGHFEPILIFFKLLFEIDIFSKFRGFILILLQSICLLYPLFLLNKNYKFLYILNPFIWNLNIFDFHSESIGFILILIIFYLHFKKKNIKYLLLFSLVLTKETFIPFIILFLIYDTLSQKKTFNIFIALIFIFSLIIIILFYFYNTYLFNSDIYINKISSKDFFYKIYNFKFITFFFLIIIFLSLLEKKYIKTLLIYFIIPLKIIFIIFFEINNYNILNQYTVYIFPIILSFIFFKNKPKTITKYIFLILFLSISSFPASMISLSDVTKNNSYKNYIISQEDLEFNNYLLKNFSKLNDKLIILDNNVINNFTSSFTNTSVFPSIYSFSNNKEIVRSEIVDNKNKIIFIKRNDERKFILDKLVSESEYKEYVFLQKNLKKIILFNNNKFEIYSIY